MKETKRYLSALLVLAMLISCFAGLALTADAATVAADALPYNSGKRHEVATALSDQAGAYYTGDYAAEKLLALTGSDSKSSLQTMDSELYKALQTLMQSTKTDGVTYEELTSYWTHTDASQGAAGTILFYSDIVEEAFNREHVWPKSHGSFLEMNAGCDLHHLRPTNSTVNSTRSSYIMSNVVDILSEWTTFSHNDGTPIWYNSAENKVEVADEIKGDVARIYLYVYCCWGQPNLFEDVATADLPPMDADDYENNGERVIEDLSTLLYWMEIDPVDTWEMSRNDIIQTVQGNRNVFIDYPELAWLLFDEDLPAGYETPSGYAMKNGVEKPTVTAVSADESQGAVRLINNVISATPAEGYSVDAYSVTPEGSATVTQDGRLFYVTDVTEDCTVTVSFAAKKGATVTYSVPEGVEAAGGSSADSFVGDSVVLPEVTGTAADAEQDYVFLGWTETPIEYAEELPENLYYPGDTYYVGAEKVTLYGLFYYKVTDETSTDKEFAKVETEPEDWSGTYCIIAGESGAIMSNTLKGNTTATNVYLLPESVTVDLNSVKNPNPAYFYTLKKVEGTDYYYLIDSNGNYIGCPKIKVMTQVAPDEADLADTAYYWQPTLNGLQSYEGTNGVLQYNTSSPRFTTYSGGQETAALYGEVAGTKTCYTSAQGHIHVFTEERVEPTCTEAGSITYTCTLCGEVIVEELPALGHSYAITEQKAATCTAEGYITYLCATCGDTYTDTLAALDCPSAQFTDVPLNTWYHDAVDTMVAAELMVGVSGDRFAPDMSLSRAMVTTVIYRMEGAPETNGQIPFTDVEAGKWYTDAICWAAENGVVNGTPNGAFLPDTDITREQMATILYNYARYKYYDTTERDDLSGFGDVENVAGYAKEPMAWAVAKGILLGVPQDSDVLLLPQANASRAQFATVIHRLQTLAAVECSHSFTATTVPATCTEAGSVTSVCSLCGKTVVEELPALGHSFGQWVLTVEPTAATEGVQERTCTVCGATEQQPVEKLGYTLTLTDTLKDGDQVLIYAPSGKVLLSTIPITAPYIQRLDDVSVVVSNNGINMLPEDAALVTVSINNKGQYSFKLGDQWLVCNSGSGSLYFSDTPTYGVWELEATDGGFLLRNVDSVKMLNGVPTPVYVEYYSGNFTSYYITSDTTDVSAFTLQFFVYSPTADGAGT